MRRTTTPQNKYVPHPTFELGVGELCGGARLELFVGATTVGIGGIDFGFELAFCIASNASWFDVFLPLAFCIAIVIAVGAVGAVGAVTVGTLLPNPGGGVKELFFAGLSTPIRDLSKSEFEPTFDSIPAALISPKRYLASSSVSLDI